MKVIQLLLAENALPNEQSGEDYQDNDADQKQYMDNSGPKPASLGKYQRDDKETDD